MIERTSTCIWCVTVLLMIAGCPGRPRETIDPTHTASPLIEDPPAADAPQHTDYPEDLLKRATNTRPRGPLDHAVNISVFAVPLGEVAGSLATLTGIGITILPHDNSGPPLHKRPVSITVQAARLSDTLEWIMRQVDAHFADIVDVAI